MDEQSKVRYEELRLLQSERTLDAQEEYEYCCLEGQKENEDYESELRQWLNGQFSYWGRRSTYDTGYIERDPSAEMLAGEYAPTDDHS